MRQVLQVLLIVFTLLATSPSVMVQQGFASLVAQSRGNPTTPTAESSLNCKQDLGCLIQALDAGKP